MKRSDYDWQQAIFDLMANRAIRLKVEGEMGDVYAALEIESIHGGFHQIIEAIAAQDFDSAMRVLMEKYQEGQRNGPH